MDEIGAILSTLAAREGALGQTWAIENTSFVLKVKVSAGFHASAAEAFAAATRMLAGIKEDGAFELVNRVDIKLGSEPIFSEEPNWQAELDFCLQRADQLTENHEIVTGI